MDELSKLKEAINFAHQRIERLTNENLEYRLLIRALLFSHSAPETLIEQIELERELFLAHGAPSEVSDHTLESVHKAANLAIERVLAHLQRGK